MNYEVIDVGSWLIVGLYVFMKEMNVNNVYEGNYIWIVDIKCNEECRVSEIVIGRLFVGFLLGYCRKNFIVLFIY